MSIEQIKSDMTEDAVRESVDNPSVAVSAQPRKGPIQVRNDVRKHDLMGDLHIHLWVPGSADSARVAHTA